MIKILNTNPNQSTEQESDHLTIDDLDMPKTIMKLIESWTLELKEKVASVYNDIGNELNRLKKTKLYPDRQRFLDKVRLSLQTYLDPEGVYEIDRPIYYIFLYFLEDGQRISYITLDSDGIVTIPTDGSCSANTAIYLTRLYYIFISKYAQPSDIQSALKEILMG